MTMDRSLIDPEQQVAAWLRSSCGSLLLKGRPSYVATAVMAVIMPVSTRRVFVESVFSRGSRANISKEPREVVSPMFADRDTTPAVERPFLDVRVGAAGDHASPDGVQAMVLPSAGEAVCKQPLARQLSRQASTTLCDPLGQSAVVDIADRPAVTLTQPLEVSAWAAGGLVEDYESSESFAGVISSDTLERHQEAPLSGVTLRAGISSAGAFSSPHLTRTSVRVQL